jgi:hypothetical protein
MTAPATVRRTKPLLNHWGTGKDEAEDDFKSGDLPYCGNVKSFGGKEIM